MWYNSSKKRFSLYFLEESEHYVQDMSTYCYFTNPLTKQEKKEKGKLHMCSKGLIFESDIYDTPILKFQFINFNEDPQLEYIEGQESIVLNVKKVISINTDGPPAPYQVMNDQKQYRIEIQPLTYYNIKQQFLLIQQLYMIFQNNRQGYDPDNDSHSLILNKDQFQFDMTLIQSVSEKPIVNNGPLNVRQIMPLISISGFLYPTTSTIYFQPKNSSTTDPITKFDLKNIIQIQKRRFELQNLGLEIFLDPKSQKNRNQQQEQKISQKEVTYYFAFESQEERDLVHDAIKNRISESMNQFSLDQCLEKWQKREMSNYEYLMSLNHAGNRSFSDMSQYPIMPWIISEYQKSQIDLNDSSIYRDLSKPIGALNAQRLSEYKKRYNQMDNPKYLYGTHYSTPGYVIGYLVRKYPQFMLKLQSGKFDAPDRLFKSIIDDYNNVYYNNACVKELIPEFYQDDEGFLVNGLNLKLGYTQDQQKVDDVIFPNWAKDAKEFLKINREALESDYVSENLHHWIDLIFGYKQRGPASIEFDNVFHPLTYEGFIDLDKIENPTDRMSYKCQINEFGQCPKQLFKIPHPQRNKLKNLSIVNLIQPSSSGDQDNQLQDQEQKIDSTKQIQKQIQNSTSCEVNQIWNGANVEYSSIERVHRKKITQIIQLEKDKNQVITIGSDGILQQIDINEKNIQKKFKISDYFLSCICPIQSDRKFAIGSWDSKIYIFNLNYGTSTEYDSTHVDCVSALAYLKNKQILFSASWDCSIKQNTINEEFEIEDEQDFIDHCNQVTALGVNDSEDIMAFGDVEGLVCVHNVDSGNQLFNFNINEMKINKLIFNQDNLMALDDKTMQFYSKTGTEITKFNYDQQNEFFTDVKLDGKNVLACTRKGHVGIYDLLQEKKTGYFYTDFQNQTDQTVEDDNKFSTLFVNDENNLVILGSENGTLHIIKKKQIENIKFEDDL